MQIDDIHPWEHTHAYGTEEYSVGERRTRWVIVLTFAMMVVEIAAGFAFGSMALLADGWHMATHAAALGISAFAYGYARQRAHDRRYSFGTGKVGALGGFASALTLAIVAVYVFVESVIRWVSPGEIRFDEAIAVAVVGLLVNLVSAYLLRAGHTHRHGDELHRDHNLRGAYLHVVADAFTSVLAIAALFAAKRWQWSWADAATGVVGSILIARWSFGLVRDTSAVLLDAEVPERRREEIQSTLEAESGDRVTDLHLWRIGPRHLAVIATVVTHEERAASHYKERLGRFDDLVHVTVEVQRCEEEHA